jgi:ectoine hydroxylase-related dioxygenase (phytanoyl-CoA dioxygenase family)
MPDMPFVAPFTANGIAIIEYALLERDLARMADTFGQGNARHTALSRDLIDWLGTHPAILELARRLTAPTARLVRVIAFDKTPDANWFVPWHQDRSIAVANRVEVPGYSNWTIKDGLIQVEPPVAVLDGMVTLRIHLDDCGEDKGPLEAILGSHTAGRLDRAGIASVVETGTRMLCLAARGDILCMRPLTVHRSQRAKVPARRRVLHLEFAAATLSDGLSWVPLTAGTA